MSEITPTPKGISIMNKEEEKLKEVEQLNTSNKQKAVEMEVKNNTEDSSIRKKNNDNTKQESKDEEKPNDINEAKSKNKNENFIVSHYNTLLKNLDPILNFIYIVSFLIVIFLQLNINMEYDSIRRIKQALGIEITTKTFEVSDFGYIYDFNNQLVFNISLSNLVLSEKFPLVSSLRSSLKRFKQTTSNHKYIQNHEFNKYRVAKSISAFDSLNENNEESSPLNNMFVYEGENSFMGKGGYVMTVGENDLKTYESTQNYDKSYVDYVENATQFNSSLIEFINNYNIKFSNSFFNIEVYPASLVYDFAVVDYEIEYIFSVYCIFTIYSSGKINFEYRISPMSTHLYTTRVDQFRLVFEIILLIIILLYLFYFVKRITYESKRIQILEKLKVRKIIQDEYFHEQRKEQEKKKILENKKKEEMKRKIQKNIGTNTKTKMRLKSNRIGTKKTTISALLIHSNNNKLANEEAIKEKHDMDDYYADQMENNSELKEYIENETNKKVESQVMIAVKLALLQYTVILASVILSILCAIFWIIFISKHSAFWLDLDNSLFLLNTRLTLSQLNDLHSLGLFLESYKVIVCLNFLVLFTRILIYFFDLVKRSTIYWTCLEKASSDILSFFIIYLTFCLAASVFCFYYYQKINVFNDFQTTFQTVVSFSINSIDDIYIDMYEENKVMTILILVFLIIFLKYIQLKIILAILIFWYHFSCNLYESKYNLVNFKTKTIKELFEIPKEISYHIVCTFIELSNSVINCLLCIKEEKRKFKAKIYLKENWRKAIGNRKILQGLRKDNKLDHIPSKTTQIVNTPYAPEEYKKNLNNIKDIDVLYTNRSAQSNNKNIQGKKDIEEEHEKQLLENQENKNNYNSTENKVFDENKKVIITEESNNKNLKRDSIQHINSENNEDEDATPSNKLALIKSNNETQNPTTTNDGVIEDDYFQKVPIDIVLCNYNMSDSDAMGKREVYFDSEKDSYINKAINEKKYRFRMLDIVFYILLFIFLVISSFMANFSPYKKLLGTSIIDFMNKKPANEENRIYNVKSSSFLKTYIFETFPSLFDYNFKHFTFLNNNFLIRNGIVLTIKKNIKKEFNIEDKGYEAYQSKEFKFRSLNESLTWSINRNENKTHESVSEELFIPYSRNKSYHEVGGYSHVISLYDTFGNLDEYDSVASNYNETDFYYDGPLKRKLTDEEKNNMIDDYTTFVFLEIYLLNYEFNLVTIIEIEIKITKGNLIYTKIEPSCLKTENSSNLSLVGFIFDVLFVIFFFISLYFFFIRIKVRYYSYIQWEKENIKTLSIRSQEVRGNINPETLRKLSFIMNGDFILNIFIFLLGILYIAFRIVNIVNTIDLIDMISADFNYTIFSYQDVLRTHVNNQNGLLHSSYLLILVMSLRFLFIIDFGKYFGITVGTIQEASGLLLIFIFILFLTQPAFISYSYICFGNNLWNYNTWISSCLYTLIQMFGEYDFLPITNTHKSLGPLHFYLYIFIINMILLNLFIATLDRAYIITKERIHKLNEDYEYKYIFFFCCYRRKKIYDIDNVKIEYEFENNKFANPPIMHLIPFKETGINTKEFIALEINKLNKLSDEVDNKNNKSSLIELAYLSNLSGVDGGMLRNMSHFKDIKVEHYNTYFLIVFDYINQIINNFQSNILDIEKYYEHLINFQRFQQFKSRTKAVHNKNNDSINEVAYFENLLKVHLKELEKYQKIELKLEGLDIAIQNDYLNECQNDASLNKDSDNENDESGVDDKGNLNENNNTNQEFVDPQSIELGLSNVDEFEGNDKKDTSNISGIKKSSYINKLKKKKKEENVDELNK